MAAYDGPVQLLVNGAVYQCRACLDCWEERETPRSFGGLSSVSGHPGWGGTVRVEGDQSVLRNLVWDISQADDLHLRIGNRRAAFSIRSQTDDGRLLRIESSGSGNTPPFDC